MTFNRLVTRLQRLAVVHLSPSRADAKFTQYQWYRRACGGMYVKIYGRWRPAEVVLYMKDKTRVIQITDKNSYDTMHETFAGIEFIENYGEH